MTDAKSNRNSDSNIPLSAVPTPYNTPILTSTRTEQQQQQPMETQTTSSAGIIYECQVCERHFEDDAKLMTHCMGCGPTVISMRTMETVSVDKMNKGYDCHDWRYTKDSLRLFIYKITRIDAITDWYDIFENAVVIATNEDVAMCIEPSGKYLFNKKDNTWYCKDVDNCKGGDNCVCEILNNWSKLTDPHPNRCFNKCQVGKRSAGHNLTYWPQYPDKYSVKIELIGTVAESSGLKEFDVVCYLYHGGG